jgi:hypothetical protein
MTRMAYAHLDHPFHDISKSRFNTSDAHAKSSSALEIFILFCLFAAYGAAFNISGQLRYVEAALLFAGLFYYDQFKSRVDRVEWHFSLLFLVTALAQLISNTFNHAPTASTIGRVGSYVLLAALVPIVAALINREWQRLLAVVLGFGVSFFVVAYTGDAVSEDYNLMPWRLGLGAAATSLAVCMFAIIPQARLLLTIGLFALAGTHLFFESRSMAAITFIVAIYCTAATFAGRPFPTRFKLLRFVMLIMTLLTFAYIGPQIFSALATTQLLPQGLVTKNENQATNEYGFLAAARPDTFTALYAISNKPLLGYGSGVFDLDVFSYYAHVSAASYQNLRLSRNVYNSILKQDWLQGIPSHSHVFGAWADGGIFAALSWFLVLWVDFKMLARLWRWGHPFAPLFAFIGVETIWDVLFSPGPVRLDIAIRLVIMATALRYLHFSDHLTGALEATPANETMQ